MALTQVSTAGVKDDAVTSGKIPANAVGSSEIAANAVGSSELADDAVDTNAIVDDAITTAKIASGAVHTAELVNSSVTTAKIVDGSVTTAKIADDAITGAKIADNAITSSNVSNIFQNAVINTSHILNNAVTTNEIADDAVTGAKIASNAIDSEHYATGSIDSAFIADQAVTLDKLPHGTSSNDGKFLRANNGADPSFESIPAGTTINSQADNRLITCSGTSDTLNAESALIWTGTTLSVGNAGVTEYNPSSAASTMTVGDMTSGINRGITIISHAAQNGGLHFGDVNDDTAGAVSYVHNGDYMRFFAASGQRANVTQHGITFGTDTAEANALNDYEEGAWTPIVTFGGNSAGQSYSHQVGRYVKIGRMVHVQCYVAFTDKGSSTGTAKLSVPYVVRNQSAMYPSAVMAYFHNGNSSSGPGSYSTFMAYGEINQTVFNIQREEIVDQYPEMNDAQDYNFADNTEFMFTCTYVTN